MGKNIHICILAYLERALISYDFLHLTIHHFAVSPAVLLHMALLIFLRLAPILQLLLPPPPLPQQRLLESLAQEETTLEMLHRGLTCQAHIIPILAEVI